ncbi:unnamed protein product [Lepeophtheirus salmonis]|uniref:(salmon louse) hypothetical protein n=1 Tax=Lepeophtheirus salmonis TaxID=72036 RepID=A0A7R8H4I7_LEPSM|nr:unnamed protein product [Lepeophtheirus salmonis]CAF2860190.1 unnamed protein product [Lepeophtheirus salmonis]
MKSFAICTFVLCSTISINAGPFLRRTRRDSPPVSSYGGEQVGAASSSGADITSFGGSAGGVVAGGSSSAHLAKHVPIPFSEIAEAIAAQIPFATKELLWDLLQPLLDLMLDLVICTSVICSAINIDAGSFFRKTGRNTPPHSSYGAGQAWWICQSPSDGSAGSSLGGSASPAIAIFSQTNNAPETLGENSDFHNAF